MSQQKRNRKHKQRQDPKRPERAKAKASRDTTSAPEAAVDRYVAELVADGKTDGPARFTLDREVAEKKLREFQLPDPDLYILLLVQAAVLQGAERIDITSGRQRLRLEYAAPPLQMRDLRQVYDAALGGGDIRDPQRRSLLRTLGLGISVARGRILRLVLVSRTGAEGVRLVVKPNAPDAYESFHEATAGQITRTTIELDFEARWETAQHELPMLRKRCRYAKTNIVVDGRSISHGLSLPEAAAKISIHRGTTRGEAGFEPLRTGSPELRIVRDGVLIDDNEIPYDDARFVAVVRDEALLTDLSGFEVVRNRTYQNLRSTVLRAAKEAKQEYRVEALCRHWISSEAEQRLDSLRGLHRELEHKVRFLSGGVALALLAGLIYGGVSLVQVDMPWSVLIAPAAVVGGLAMSLGPKAHGLLKHHLMFPRLTQRCLTLLPPKSPLWDTVEKQAWRFPQPDLDKALKKARKIQKKKP